MLQPNQAMRDFIRHSHCVNYYTNKQVWIAPQGRHYHVSGCPMGYSDGPNSGAVYHKDLSNESAERYIPCSCTLDDYQESLHDSLNLKHVC